MCVCLGSLARSFLSSLNPRLQNLGNSKRVCKQLDWPAQFWPARPAQRALAGWRARRAAKKRLAGCAAALILIPVCKITSPQLLCRPVARRTSVWPPLSCAPASSRPIESEPADWPTESRWMMSAGGGWAPLAPGFAYVRSAREGRKGKQKQRQAAGASGPRALEAASRQLHAN